MTATMPIISFGKSALSFRDDATYILEAGTLQSFSNLDDLKYGIRITKPYATFEPNFWILDGNYKFLPNVNAHAGLMGNTLSQVGTGFSVPIQFFIEFGNVHSISNLNIVFSEYSNDFIDSIEIKFYNAADAVIRVDTYSPATPNFDTNQEITNFKKVHIILISTNKGERFPRVSAITFEEPTSFTGDTIKNASLIENINPLSDELTINTLDFELFSSSGDFSIVDPKGIYATLQNKEPVDVHEQLGNEIIYLGRFYLDKWESLSENVATFEASDAIGLLDKPTFVSGLYQSPVITVGDLIADIMETAGLGYYLDSSLASYNIDGGFLEVYTSCRKALQQVAFYAGAYVTCARSNVINILPLKLAPFTSSQTITRSQKGINSPLVIKSLVTGVEIIERDYFSDDFPTGEILYSNTLSVGTHTVILYKSSKMAAGLVLGGTATYSIVTNRYLYCIINVTVTGTVILTQNEGKNTKEVVNGVYTPSLPTGVQENVVTINDVTLITTSAVGGKISTSTITQRVYDYYQQRYIQKAKLFGSSIKVGDVVAVDVQSNRQMKGVVERMETNLTGGFISETEIVGVII